MSVTDVTSARMGRSRNAYMLGPKRKSGYDWWWHSLVAVHRASGTERPFFFEYYVINPGLSRHGEGARLGDGQGGKPSYAMLKAGAWGLPGGSGHQRPVQIDNCWPISQFQASDRLLDVAIGPNRCTETALSGAVFAGQKIRREGWPSDGEGGLAGIRPGPGVLSWDLRVSKLLGYSVGYGASACFRALRAFRMFWHVEGMKAEYSGTITLDGEIYDVLPGRNYGYQDKNWGSDYTNPWIWLNCNSFVSCVSGESLANTSLDVGGGRPEVFGLALPRRILVAFWHGGQLHEFNFAKFWRRGRQEFSCTVGDQAVRWELSVENHERRLEIDFACPKDTMIKVDYENPAGFRHHRQLWNGGWASGVLRLYRRRKPGEAGPGSWVLEDTLQGSRGGCEFGVY